MSMMRVKETLEFLDKGGNVVKKRRPKYIGYCPEWDKNVFKGAMDGLQKKMENVHTCRMNMVERVVDGDFKAVFLIKMVLNFEYDQRWTYELVE